MRLQCCCSRTGWCSTTHGVSGNAGSSLPEICAKLLRFPYVFLNGLQMKAECLQMATGDLAPLSRSSKRVLVQAVPQTSRNKTYFSRFPQGLPGCSPRSRPPGVSEEVPRPKEIRLTAAVLVGRGEHEDVLPRRQEQTVQDDHDRAKVLLQGQRFR